jgi:hypothetical protein
VTVRAEEDVSYLMIEAFVIVSGMTIYRGSMGEKMNGLDRITRNVRDTA